MIEWQSLVCINISVYQGENKGRDKEKKSLQKWKIIHLTLLILLIFVMLNVKLCFFLCSPKNKATNVTRIDNCTALTRWETTKYIKSTCFHKRAKREKKYYAMLLFVIIAIARWFLMSMNICRKKNQKMNCKMFSMIKEHQNA